MKLRQNYEINAHGEFSVYGPSHWAALAVFAAGAVAVVWLGRRQTERQARVFDERPYVGERAPVPAGLSRRNQAASAASLYAG